MDPIEYKGPILVTIVYFFIYYFLITNILRVKIKLHRLYRNKGQKFDRYFNQDREMLIADRNQLNMLEHMPAFLFLMWMHAIFISIQTATTLGAIYTLLRVLYPFIMGKRIGRDIPKRILFVTFSSYLILVYFIFALVKAIF